MTRNLYLSILRPMTTAIALSTLLLGSCAQTPQKDKLFSDPDSLTVAEKIKLVENNLSSEKENAGWNITDRMTKYHVMGLSIGVIHHYKLEWAKGYGWADADSHIAVTTQTLFQAASMSKSINAVGILKLAQDSKLDLYTDINQYLKSWKFPYDSITGNKKITIANLLSHTAGLTVHGFAGYAQGEPLPTIYQILDGKKPANSAAIRPMIPPGIKSEYSGGGTTISQLIVMDLTQEPYDQYMRDSVLLPMGMTASSYTQPAPKGDNYATGYRQNGDALPGKYHVYPEEAAAGLWTNPTDYSKYIIETQLSYAGRSEKVLSQANTRVRLTPYIDTVAALGTFIVRIGDHKFFSHSGGNEGFRCYHMGSLEGGEGIVVMVNSDNGAILNEVVNSVSSVYRWKNSIPASGASR